MRKWKLPRWQDRETVLRILSTIDDPTVPHCWEVCQRLGFRAMCSKNGVMNDYLTGLMHYRGRRSSQPQRFAMPLGSTSNLDEPLHEFSMRTRRSVLRANVVRHARSFGHKDLPPFVPPARRAVELEEELLVWTRAAAGDEDGGCTLVQ